MSEWASIVVPVVVAIVASIPGVLAYASKRDVIRREQEDSALDAWQALLTPQRERVAELERLSHEQAGMIHDLSAQVATLQAENRRMSGEIALLQHKMMAYYRQLIDAQMTPDPNYVANGTLSPDEAQYASVAGRVQEELAAEAAEDREMAAYRQQLVDAGIEPDPDYGAGGGLRGAA